MSFFRAPIIAALACLVLMTFNSVVLGDEATISPQVVDSAQQTVESPEYGSIEYWRAETERRFDEWKSRNPDYERQIYDGVKRTQKDLLVVLRFVVIGFAVLALILGVLALVLWLSTRHIKPRDRPGKLEKAGKGVKSLSLITDKLRVACDALGRRGVVFKISLSLSIVVLFTLSLEAYLRLSDDPSGRVQSTAGMWDLTPCWPHGYQKGASVRGIVNPDGSKWDFTSNQNGFRANNKDQQDELVTMGNDHQELRVAIIGSSFILGYSTSDEDTLTAQFEDLVNQRNLFPWPVKVMNFGGPARSGAATVFKGYFCDVQKYAPDVIVWASGPDYSMSEDLKDVVGDLKKPPTPDWRETKSNYIDEDGFLRAYSTDNPWLRELVTRSALFRHIVSRMRITSFNKTTTRTFADDLVRLIEETPSFAGDIVQGHDIIAAEDRVMIFLLQRGVDINTFDTYGIRDVDPWGTIVNELRVNGVPVVSTVGQLNHEKYYSPDSHWSAAGNRVVAEHLLTGFKEHKEAIESVYKQRLSLRPWPSNQDKSQ